MNKLVLYLLLFLPISGFAQQRIGYPPDVEAVLKKAGKNRAELEKVITYCRTTKDPLKLKAAYFLISNMDIHFAANYYWADKNGNKVTYNELSYLTYDAAISALNAITAKTPGIHAVTTTVPDISCIKADFLINNINAAFREWKSSPAKNIPFADFCEYILPYRVSVEPLQDWRTKYQQKFQWFSKNQQDNDIQKALGDLANNNKAWFSSTYGTIERKEPLPRLGALQILFRKKGLCQDIADLQVFALRSQGVPVSLNTIPYWATSTGSHFVNTVFDPNMQPLQFDVSKPTPLLNKSLSSEPSKVIRSTYSRQKGVLAGFVDTKNIPEGFMRTLNYVDITNQYWETTNVRCSLAANKTTAKIAYACILNSLTWRPTWWGKVDHGEVTFNNMSKGVVYLPTYYINGRIEPAGYPVAEGYHHELVLAPNLGKRRTIVLQQEVKYLSFQSGKKYKLFYWNNKWKLLAVQTAAINATSMMFYNVPANSLLLLLPEYSKKKERPFIITEDGTRNWF